MNSTIISDGKIKEMKSLVQIIEDNSLPFPALSVEIQEHEKREKEKTINKLIKLIKKL